MNIFRATKRAVPIRALEGEAAIGDEMGRKSEIARHANCRLDRVVGDDAHHNQAVVAAGPKRSSKSVPMNALLVRLRITVSPAIGAASTLKLLPGWPGR
jgi:hypothetical protein